MTQEKLLLTIDKYEKKFKEMEITPLEFPLNKLMEHHKFLTLGHCYAMLPDLRKFVEEGTQKKLEKAFRWIGFIQGVLWSKGIFTIDEMRYDNM